MHTVSTRSLLRQWWSIHALDARWVGATLALDATLVVVCFGEHIISNWKVVQWEDPRFFAHVENLRSFADIFGTASAWEGIYRPVSTNLVYVLGRLVGHPMPLYHGLLIAVYLANAVLFFDVCRRVTSNGLALLASALASSRLANTETLLYATQLQTTLPLTFALLALRYALVERDATLRQGLVVFGWCLLALLSKEQMVVLPAVLIATTVTHRLASRRRSWSPWETTLTLASVTSTVVWFVWARRFLKVGDNPWWAYDFSPSSLLRNFTAYSCSFSNLALGNVSPHAPAVFLDEYPQLMNVATAARFGFGAVLVALAAVFALALRRASHQSPPATDKDTKDGARLEGGPSDRETIDGSRPPGDVAAQRYPDARALVLIAALGIVWFVSFSLPFVVFVDRRLLYYGYASHLGLSLTIAALVGLSRAVVRGRRSKPASLG